MTEDAVRFEIAAVTAKDDRVAVITHGYAHLSDGTECNVHRVLFRIRDGRIAHQRVR